MEPSLSQEEGLGPRGPGCPRCPREVLTWIALAWVRIHARMLVFELRSLKLPFFLFDAVSFFPPLYVLSPQV